MSNIQTKKQKRLVKYGDIFKIGNHILACGSCLDKELMDRVLKDKKITLILSDPPYGVDYIDSKKGFSKVKKNKKIINDDILDEREYINFTKEWLEIATYHLKRKNSIYIFNSDKMIFALREGMRLSNLKFSQLIVWIKNHSIVGRKDYLPQHELIAYGWHGSHKFHKSKDKSIIFCPKPNKSNLHPTQKPISLLRRLILNSSNVGDIVYDCFAGSGSTGIACENTKRSSILIEFEPEYCQTIINRFDKLFGLKAKKI